jgi:hypothetical protein
MMEIKLRPVAIAKNWATTVITMKQLILFFTFLLLLTNLLGQKTELRGALNSGMFSFSGHSSGKTTSINWNDRTNSGYTNNPYGSESALCYGFSFNIKRVTKKHLILGFDLGYECLRSKISIDKIDGYDGISVYQYSAKGKTFLDNYFLNFNPFLGYRILSKNISFDFTGGIEAGYCLHTIEKGTATGSNGNGYSTSRDNTSVKIDIRPGFQIAAYYHKFGLYTGYSSGLVNYRMYVIGDGIWESFSRLVRFGVTYRIN